MASKSPTVILIYAPIGGCSWSDGRVDSSIRSMFDIIKSDGYLKTNFGNLSSIKRFIELTSEYGIDPTTIKLLKINDNGEEEDFNI